MRWTSKAVTWGLVGLLGAVGGCTKETGGGGGGTPEGGQMSGKVVDARGQPMSGVTVVADNTMIYNSNALATTGSDGTYRIDVSKPAGTWHASATHKVQYNARSYTFDLDPNDDAVFAGNEGAVRNFTWKLSGKRADDTGNYGGFVAVYVDQLIDPADPEQAINSDDIELTLTPSGKLVDGSDGAPITKKLVRTPDGDAVQDVPVGRYTVTARYAQAGKSPRPMQVRIRDTGDYADSVTADFDVLTTTRHQILLNAQLPTP
ncbi:carboxypeptidase-like regulatory domain-containing protein [Corallococcus sp. bb12-1]|uniref:carboxypeptidase-like regulatory domain-containing protein n=1 Tax=Corallococcus sp. bb12-1 TaxID=2996784 RepID=UPI0022702F48|nr:carboxypeptidase-like regulatory domain-containing protein [Corallococcus sp. bb12-1]MCY1045175.1 carboxypeptidase-like regulatory domain-containing protein [Corallococcus sp. bb12-1]